MSHDFVGFEEAKQSTQADDVLSVLRPFARFLSHEEHEQLRKSVIS